MRVFLAAEESAGVRVLQLLLDRGHDVVGVAADPGRAARGGAGVWQAAGARGLRTWPAAAVREPGFSSELAALQPDLLLNVHSLYVICPEVIAAPRLGAFNLHPGPLPRYAGLNAVSWALYRGETEHGVTLHEITPRIDAGRIFAQRRFPIEPEDSALTVSARCIELGLELVGHLLDAADEDDIGSHLTPQDLTQREYFGRRAPDEAWIDWSRPARDVVNLVRACDYAPFPSPWGQARSLVEGEEIHITKVTAEEAPADAPPGAVGEPAEAAARVAAADRWVLVTRMMAGGRRVRPAETLRRGVRLARPESGHPGSGLP